MSTELLSLRTKISLLSLSTVDRLNDLNIGYHLPRCHRSSHGVKRRSEWKFPLRGRITYRHCQLPKLTNFLYSSNRLFGGGAAAADIATQNFCLSVPAISKLTTLTVESLGLRRPKPRNTSSWRLMRRASNNNNRFKKEESKCAYIHCSFI